MFLALALHQKDTKSLFLRLSAPAFAEQLLSLVNPSPVLTLAALRLFASLKPSLTLPLCQRLIALYY